jgi:hypothetical protein
MIEVYCRSDLIKSNRPDIHSQSKLVKEFEYQSKQKEENFHNKLLRFHSIGDFSKRNSTYTVSGVALSLSARKLAKCHRKYSCPEEVKSKEVIGKVESNFFEKEKFLKVRIQDEVTKAQLKIVKFFRSIKERKKKQNETLVSFILAERKRSATLIQKTFRMFRVRNDMKDILAARDYILFYKYENQLCKIIQLKIHTKKSTETLDFKFSKTLDIYFIVLSGVRLIKKMFKVNFIIDGKVILDARYPVHCDRDLFYNIIKSNCLIKFMRSNRPVVHKSWERVFEIKSNENDTKSTSDLSASEQPDIDKFMKKILNWSSTVSFKNNCNEDFNLKPILKRARTGAVKRVTFADKDYMYHY